MRGTLLLYCKHLLDNNHRENVKKLSDENRFIPTIYEQAIHLAFHNNVSIKNSFGFSNFHSMGNLLLVKKDKNKYLS